MFALLGWRGYALIGIGLAFLALGGVIYVQRLEHKADVATLALAQQNLESVSNALRQSEADKADLARQIGALDEALKNEHALQAKLEKDKRALSEKLDDIKKTLPKEDQDCFSRDLPPAILGLLRDGPADPNPNRDAQGSGKPADALH